MGAEPGHAWEITFLSWLRKALVSPEELEEVGRRISDSCSSYLDQDKCQKMNRWMEDIKLSEEGSFPHSEKCR